MKRRNFIQNTATAAILAGFSNVAFGANPQDLKPSNAAKFKLKYAPGFGSFPELAGNDPVEVIKFCSDQGFRAMFDNGLSGHSIDQQEKSVIIVRVDDGMYSNKDQKDVTGDYQFFIDCYSYSEQIGSDGAYYLSSVKMQRLMRLVRAILQDQSYRTLDFTPPAKGGTINVKATNVVKMKIGTRADMPDSLAETCGRVMFSVEVSESVENKATVALADSYNTFYMGITDKGYQVIETT